MGRSHHPIWMPRDLRHGHIEPRRGGVGNGLVRSPAQEIVAPHVSRSDGRRSPNRNLQAKEDEKSELSTAEMMQVQGGEMLAVGELPDIPIFRLPK